MTEDSVVEKKTQPAPVPKEERERREKIRARWQLFKNVRQVVQLLLLALFLLLVWSTTRSDASRLPVALFSRFDALMAFAAMLSSRSLIGYALGGLITILVTLALGRVWCGWICPLGTILDLYGRRVTLRLPSKLRRFKYVLLFAVIAAAVLGSLAWMWLDPITILVRPLSGTVYAAILRQMAVQARSATASRWSYAPPPKPYVYPLLAMPLVVVLALNLFARRFWCRYLCPLGAWVAVVSKFAWFKRRVSDRCVQCKACVKVCPVNTIREGDFASDPAECVQCLSCFARCPTAAIEEKGNADAALGNDYDPSRRQVVASLAVGLVSAGLLKTDLLKSNYSYQLRPPGATEAEFLSRCVRCGQCVKVCPSNALHLATFEAGIESLWTPLLIPRIGNCEWDCNACGQVCPTQAIPKLPLAQKRKAVIGTAVVDLRRCIRCHICIERCPVPGALMRGRASNLRGQYPIVAADKCIGCGLCEFVCPVVGESAIRVVAPKSGDQV